MKIDLIKLNTKGRVDFDENPDFEGYSHESIKEFRDVRCQGFILDNGTEDYEVNLHIMGTMILKSAVNSSDVPYELDIKFDDFVTNLVENYKISSNSLDILPIIWENILLEIPIRAVNETDEFQSIQGEGWEILDAE